MAATNIVGLQRTNTPKINLRTKDPYTQALVSLLVPEGNSKKQVQGGGRSDRPKPSMGMLQRLSQMTSTNIDANKEMMESVPGAFKACQILTASILAPRNLRTQAGTYTTASYEGKNTELNSLLLTLAKDYIEKNYKITDKLAEIVPDCLMLTGSSIWAVLSESALDNVINGHVKASMESLGDEIAPSGQFTAKGYLGNPNGSNMVVTASLESLISGQPVVMSNPTVIDNNLYLEVLDNDSVLKMPALKLALARKNMAKHTRTPYSVKTRKGYGLEANVSGNKGKASGDIAKVPTLSEEQYVDIYNELFKQRDYATSDDITIPRDDQLTRENVGQPLLMHLPSEAVIPVHVPGNRTNHVGYFVLLDEDGNPLHTAIDDDYYQNLAKNHQDTNNAVDSSKGIVEMARQVKEGGKVDFSITEFYGKYVDEVIRDLTARLANGTYAQTMTVGMNNEVARIMFARTCKNIKTRLLYIPVESVTYFAFDYNRFGIGRSLLDKSRLYASMAMANIISTTLANIAASVNITTLDIPLDEDDVTPEQTIEDVVSTHLNSTLGLSSIIGAKNPRDICSILDSASVIVKTSGNDHYPSINVDVTHSKRDITPPDPEWSDRLMEYLAQQWGVRPELLSSNNEIKFAIEHLNNDALFCKEIAGYQKKVCANTSDLIRKLVAKSGNLMDDLYQEILNNKGLWAPSSKRGKKMMAEFKEDNPEVAKNDDAVASRLLTNFINSITYTLPEIEITDLEDVSRGYATRREYVENVIKDRFPDEVLGKFLDGNAEDLDLYRQNLISYYMRKWMDDSGNAEQFQMLNTVGDDSNVAAALLSEINTYNEQMLEGLLAYLKEKKTIHDKLDKKFQTLVDNGSVDETNPASPVASTEEGFGGDEGDGTNEDDFGGASSEDDVTGENDTSTEEDATNAEDDVKDTTEEDDTTTTEDKDATEGDDTFDDEEGDKKKAAKKKTKEKTKEKDDANTIQF